MRAYLDGTVLQREKRVGSRLIATLLFTGLTGLVTWLWPAKAGVWQQWTFLVHTAQGALLAWLLGIYLYLHFRRTLALRRPGIALAGLVVAVLGLAFVGTGIHIALFGQTEAHRTVYWVHVVSGCLALAALLAHVALHWVSWPSGRSTPRPHFFAIEPVTLTWLKRNAIVAVGVVAVGSTAYALLPSPFVDAAAIQPYNLSKYGPHPFEPSKNHTANGGFYDAKRLNVSADCGSCHTDIYKEWSASIHAKAGADRAYQTNVNLLANKKGIEATRYCEGCHVPVAIMSGQLSKGGRLDTFGHLHEGVGCLGCHAIDSVDSTAGVASYTLRPPSLYLFGGYDNAVARAVNHYVTRLNPHMHRSEMARASLPKSEMCAVCHAQFMEKVMNDWGWVKMQDDYMSWLNGPFSGQSKHTFARGDVSRCQDCHFPLTAESDPSADEHGQVRSHFSLGANTAIPYVDKDIAQIRRTAEFLQANKVTLSIDKPSRDDAVTNGRYVQPDITHLGESTSYFYLGEEATINIVVANVAVGHDFPGGTSDINEAWIRFVATDAQGQLIYESGALEPNGAVDPNAYFYRALAVDKSGALVWRHDLFRMVGDAFKKVIEPGASDVVTYKVKIPAWAKSPMNIYAVVRYRKLNDQYAKWALKDEKIELPIVDVASDTLKVSLREKAEVVAQDVSP